MGIRLKMKAAAGDHSFSCPRLSSTCRSRCCFAFLRLFESSASPLSPSTAAAPFVCAADEGCCFDSATFFFSCDPSELNLCMWCALMPCAWSRSSVCHSLCALRLLYACSRSELARDFSLSLALMPCAWSRSSIFCTPAARKFLSRSPLALRLRSLCMLAQDFFLTLSMPCAWSRSLLCLRSVALAYFLHPCCSKNFFLDLRLLAFHLLCASARSERSF